MEKFEFNKQIVWSSPLKPNLWRPLTDNDRLGKPHYNKELQMFSPDSFWKKAQLINITHNIDQDRIVHVSVVWKLPNGIDLSEYLCQYTIFGTGDIWVIS